MPFELIVGSYVAFSALVVILVFPLNMELLRRIDAEKHNELERAYAAYFSYRFWAMFGRTNINAIVSPDQEILRKVLIAATFLVTVLWLIVAAAVPIYLIWLLMQG